MKRKRLICQEPVGVVKGSVRCTRRERAQAEENLLHGSKALGTQSPFLSKPWKVFKQ